MKTDSPPASSQPSFAERVAALDISLQTDVPRTDKVMVEDLLACIREQQAALRAINAEVQWFVSRRKNLDEAVDGDAVRSWADVLGEDLKPVRAVLAKWRIE